MKSNIFFIGFMGTGKSTIGRLVAERLKLNFVDTDYLIEEQCSISIPNIFKRYGEDYFRELEHELILKLINAQNVVISTGGGTPLYSRNMKLMKDNGLVITLETSAHILWKRLKDCETRPLLLKYNTYEKFRNLYEDRNNIYRQAHYTIKTDGKSIGQVVDEAVSYILSCEN